MFRRARFSVKPNVRPAAAGRSGSARSGSSSVIEEAAAPGSEAQPGSGPTACSSAAGVDAAPQSGAAARGFQQEQGASSSRDEKTSDASGDGDGSKRSETVLQRRKRISTMPNLAKPRVAPPSKQRAVSLLSKCPQKSVPHPPACGTTVLQKESISPEKINIENSSKSPILPEKKTPVPQVPQFSPFKKSVSKEPNACVMAQKIDDALQKNTFSPLKERPTQDKLIQEEMPPSKSALAKEKRISSDREKILKARKLRKLLKEELKKEKQQRKYKCPIIEKSMPEDRSKMLMRDFIYYLPENNPMKSSLVEEKKIEKTSTVTQPKEPEQKAVADHEDENEETEEEGEDEDSPLLVPRVKVAEDGSIILDEESLTVEVLRTKGQCVVEENDPIFERGSTTTYSSFRKSYYTKPWSEKETDMFFLAISMVGTDFSMISQLFPHRARTEIKNKFKREEKINGWRIDKAFKEKKPFDFGFFAKLLEKVLENERRKKTKDAKCQSPKEKISKEEKTQKYQKKQKAKDVSGQPNHVQDDQQNSIISDAEMEVDSGTAEKENEESLSMLEQAEGQTAVESGVAKKKRKRRKKDSEQEADNLSEERTISAEMSEGERFKKKRKNASSSGIVSEDLEILDGETPDPVEEEPRCFIQLNEEAEGDASLTSSSIQHNALLEAESGELDISEANFEHDVGQPSKSSPRATKIGFEETVAAKNEVAELDELDENCSIPAPSLDETMETEGATTEKPKVEGQLQKLKSDLTRVSEKREPQVNDTSEVQTALSESLGGTEKGRAKDKVTKVTGPTIEEVTEGTNSDMKRESQETQKAVSEKVEVRGRRQKPKPNIAKVPSRKEAPVQGKLECRIACQGPVGKVEKSNDLNDAPNATTVEAAEKDCQSFDTETQACEKSLLQESSKPTILKAAPLARGRMQRPKPNLGRVARRQDSTRNTEAEGEKLTAVTETKKMQMDPECSHDELLIKDTAAIFPSNMVPTVLEATTYEDDMPHSEILENKDVSSSKKVSSAHTSHPPAQEPLDCENCELKKTSLSGVSVEDVSDLAAEDFSLQEEQKEMAPLKSYPLNQKEDLGKVAETKTFENKHETEKGSIKLTSEYSKDSNLNEAAKCEILPSSHSSEQHSADAHDAIATLKTHQSPQKSSDLDSGGPNKISLSSDIKEETSIGKQSSQGKSNQDAIQPPQLLRGRFQRPKPNIGRAIGRKETQYVEKNEATLAIAGTEKSEVQTFARTSSTIPPLPCNNKVLPAEALENRLVDCEKSIQEDSRVISDQCARKKSTFQEDMSCTIKPARLVRGRFQRARPNLGRMSDKKEETVSENASASVDSGLGKTETEVISKGDVNIPSVDEGSVHTSLDYLEKKDKLESSVATSPETYSEQKKSPSFKMLQECELLKGQEETCTSKDIEGKYLDIPGSDISAPQEINQTRSINPTQLLRGLQKPKPNLSRAAKKRETFSEGEISTKDKIEKDTESDDSLCGSKSGKISVLGHDFGKVVEASSSEASKEKKCTEITEAVSSKRSRPSGKCESLEQLSENESQIGKDISKPVSAQERASEILKRKQPERSLKQRKNTCESKTTSSTSECETDHGEKGRHLRKAKPNVSKGKSLKPALGRKSRKEFGSSKVNLVTLRASSQEEEEDDDADDFEPDYEPECFLPEEVNKAPVFVPKGLRSPNPVPVQIEETMEELEIYENVTEELCIATAENLCPELNVATEPVIQGDKELPSSLVVISQKESEKKTGANDGSTEAAMTLLAMRDPVFQLNTTQEKTQEFPNQEELNITDNFSKEPNEEQSIIHSDLPLSVVSKHELVSSSNTNKAEPKDPSTSALEECSQEATRVCSDLSASKENKISKLRRCRFPKPNLSKSLRLNRNAPQKSLNPSSDVAQSNEIWDDKFSVLTLKECLTQREEKASKNVTEEQKVELEQNLQLDKLANSSMDEHDLQGGSSCQAIQENNAEREDLLRETWESRSELTPKPSPKAESSPPELPSEPNTDINVQFPEKVSGPAEYQLSAVDIAQTEANKHLGVSATTEITAESHSIVEHPEAEEEQTFILTLVEISAASEDCSDESTSLQQASEELLLAPVLFTPDNAETAELTRKNSIRSTTVTAEENAAFMDNATETEELQVASAEHFAQPQPSSSSWENQERDAVALERSASLPEKKKTSSFAGESLKSSNKETSLKLRCIPRKAAEKSSEKLNMSKKRNSSTSNLICETSELQVNEPQSCLNLEAVLLDEAASSDEQVSRTVHAGKAETSEEQRRFVSIWKSEELKQVGSAAVLPKMPLSRPSQKSLGFLPLICKKNNTDEEKTTKRNKQSLQKPLTLEPTSTALSSRDKKEETHRNSSLSTTYSSSTKCENVSSSTIQFHSDLPKNEGSPKEQEKDEEPTKISEYFFSDIFMEVDDSE